MVLREGLNFDWRDLGGVEDCVGEGNRGQSDEGNKILVVELNKRLLLSRSFLKNANAEQSLASRNGAYFDFGQFNQNLCSFNYVLFESIHHHKWT